MRASGWAFGCYGRQCDRAQAQWGGLLRLAVHDATPEPSLFYAGLGFVTATAETNSMTLEGAALWR
jgi:hypothetical protein